MPPALRLLRPKQWTKGLLVFAALLFTRSYLEPDKVLLAVVAFVAIGLVSSAVYVANDLADVARDRAHPVKRHRPLAAGQVSRPVALVLGSFCLALGLALAAWLGVGALALVGIYLAMQVAYNVALKRQPVADVFCIATGFVLRAALGAAALGVAISGWLLFCTGALALLLGFGKRRHEFLLQGEGRADSRESLAGYNRAALDALVLLAAASAAMSYGIYSLESPTARQYPGLVSTSLPVFYGIYRYVFLLLAQAEGGEPENLLFRDRHLVVSVIGFIAAALGALSGLPLPFLAPAA